MQMDMQTKHQQTGANSNNNSLPAPTNTSFRINNPKDVVHVETKILNREIEDEDDDKPCQAQHSQPVNSANSPI
jgi:hypothetical protein